MSKNLSEKKSSTHKRMDNDSIRFYFDQIMSVWRIIYIRLCICFKLNSRIYKMCVYKINQFLNNE